MVSGIIWAIVFGGAFFIFTIWVACKTASRNAYVDKKRKEEQQKKNEEKKND